MTQLTPPQRELFRACSHGKIVAKCAADFTQYSLALHLQVRERKHHQQLAVVLGQSPIRYLAMADQAFDHKSTQSRTVQQIAYIVF